MVLSSLRVALIYHSSSLSLSFALSLFVIGQIANIYMLTWKANIERRTKNVLPTAHTASTLPLCRRIYKPHGDDIHTNTQTHTHSEILRRIKLCSFSTSFALASRNFSVKPLLPSIFSFVTFLSFVCCLHWPPRHLWTKLGLERTN